MSIRSKYASIFAVSLGIGTAAIGAMSLFNLQGYALLPFVIIAGISLLIAFLSLIRIIFPSHHLVEDTIWTILFDMLFGRLFH